jgi:TPR repeat protein
MKTKQSLISNFRLFRQCLLLGFFLTPVMAVGQAFDFEEMLEAASQGDAIAQYNLLGIMYQNGEGVPEDDTEAVKWYRLVADSNVIAQNNLGVMYYRGQGVPVNYVTAYAWWNIAAASGHEDASDNRAIVEEQMTSAQIAEAQKLSTKIFDRIQQGN